MINLNLFSAALTFAVGLFFIFRLRFFFILHPVKIGKKITAALRDRTMRRSLCLALAGTLGVGNIYGVALGIILGGEGSLFWLFVSSFFAMAIKYSESFIAVKIGVSGSGMMPAIRQSFRKIGKPLAYLYCLFMLLLALFMGAFIQSESLVSSAHFLFPIKKIYIALAFALSIIFVVFGGGEKIKSTAAFAIPLATVFYVLICLFVIIKNCASLPSVTVKILTSAFSFKSAFGGTVPTCFVAFSQGFCRGLLSNEAGTGTSAMAHSEVQKDPVNAGLFGILEIIFDTNLLCILTGLVILLVGSPSPADTPMSLVFRSFFVSLGKFSLFPLLFCIFLFAHSTVICWYYYGRKCLSYLGAEKLKIPFLIAFVLFLLMPSFSSGYFAVFAADMLLFLMSIISLSCLAVNSKTTSESTKNTFNFRK